MGFWRKQRLGHSGLKKVLVQELDQADKGFSLKDMVGTNIIQECQRWAMGKGPKWLKNIKKMLIWGNGHTQAV